MQVCDIVQLRLQNTGLDSSPFGSPVEVVAHLGAVQAQDFAAAKWAIGSRVQTATDEMVENSFNEGKFLRTHIMRPTWHFVMPEDIRWMQELTAPHVKRILATYDKKLNINGEMISRSQTAIGEALQGRNYLTRAELADQLEKSNILARGQRLAHILYHAELNALICNGPRRGKKFTYALLEEAVPKAKNLSREKALAQLALKYFSSHGPAQVADFAWWSGLSAKEANEAINLNKPKLTGIISEGKTYWFSHNTKAIKQKSINAHDSAVQAFLNKEVMAVDG